MSGTGSTHKKRSHSLLCIFAFTCLSSPVWQWLISSHGRFPLTTHPSPWQPSLRRANKSLKFRDVIRFVTNCLMRPSTLDCCYILSVYSADGDTPSQNINNPTASSITKFPFSSVPKKSAAGNCAAPHHTNSCCCCTLV
jgi:hypothetical protein